MPFGLPGVNKAKKVSNGNYLWISYFWSYLNAKGRAGFVMSSQASSAGHGEKEVRKKIVPTGDVDLIISIRSNFFYTRTVPCELWFFDRNKPESRRDKVLMLDARNVFRKVTRKIYDFSPEQMQNLTSIVWLQDRFPAAELQAVPGLVKLVDLKDIEAADWSLTPGRYVGVAPQEVDEDFDFEQTLRDIHTELADLDKEALELATKIRENFEELGV